jgi:hypothetical protein
MNLPTVENLILETPLYDKFTVSESDSQYLFSLIYFHDKIDGFCPFCDKVSTFRGTQSFPTFGPYKPTEYAELEEVSPNAFSDFFEKIYTVKLVCTRNESHPMQMSFYLTDGKLLKIGQFPSIADLSMPSLRKYREVLTSEKYKELRACLNFT